MSKGYIKVWWNHFGKIKKSIGRYDLIFQDNDEVLPSLRNSKCERHCGDSHLSFNCVTHLCFGILNNYVNVFSVSLLMSIFVLLTHRNWIILLIVVFFLSLSWWNLTTEKCYKIFALIMKKLSIWSTHN